MRLPLCIAPLIVSTWLSSPVQTIAAPPLPGSVTASAIALSSQASSQAAPSNLQQFTQDTLPLFGQQVVEQARRQNFFLDSRWLLAGSLFLASSAVTWGVIHYVRQQQWQRIEFLRRAVKEFEQDPPIHNALKILDFEEYRDYFTQEDNTQERIRFRVNDALLCNALANHDARARQKNDLEYHADRDDLDPDQLRRYQIESTLRDWFNDLLNGLEHFGYFLESGLFTQQELEPWLHYWIKLIADPAYRRPGASKFYDALYSYIHSSGFAGVQKLFERFGYRILPSPYNDYDLTRVAILHQKSSQSKRNQSNRYQSKSNQNSQNNHNNGNALPGYSTQLALTLSKAAYLAYQDKQFVAEIVGRWGAALTGLSSFDIIRHNFRYFNNKGRDTQAYMLRTDSFMILAFRGSQEPKDWLTNFTTQLRNFTLQKDGITTLSSYQGRVHTGFFLGWASIENSVLAQIFRWQKDCEKNEKPMPPLYVTGHSLGGALATIAAAALTENAIEVAGVYTFGQPRVGDRTFVRQLSARTGNRVFRFVNNNDVVPHVPPPFSIWNPTRLYGHLGQATYFNGKGNIIPSGGYSVAGRLTDVFLGVAKGFLGAGFNYITDHRMEYYISHLDDALKEEIENEASKMLDV